MKRLAMLGKSLSKNEMKKIIGGVVAPKCTCSCTGSVGEWEYTGQPDRQQVNKDIAAYCNPDEGTCNTACTNIK